MLTLSHPYALFLLILPFIIWQLCKNKKQVQYTTIKIPLVAHLQRLSEYRRFSLNHFIWWFLWACFGFLVIALADPQRVGEPVALKHKGYNILMALDLSGSMQTPDMRLNHQIVSRLAVVKKTAESFVQGRPGDNIGLILFGTKAYLISPLTSDRTYIKSRIKDATVGLAGQTTALGDALGQAVKNLMHAPKKSRIVILLTDGMNNAGSIDPIKAAEIAKAQGIKVYTIGLGHETINQMPGFSLNGFNQAELDETTLKKIAQLTEGQYFKATDASSLSKIYKAINQLEKITHVPKNLRPRYQYYPWIVAFILCLGLLTLLLHTYLYRSKKGDLS